MKVVFCDKCKFEFEIKEHVDYLNNGVRRHYLKCPNCKAEYQAYITTPKVRALRVAGKIVEYEREFKKVQALKTKNLDG